MDFGVVGRAAATVFVAVEFGGGATAGETEAARFEHCDGFGAVAIAGIAKGRRMGDAIFAAALVDVVDVGAQFVRLPALRQQRRRILSGPRGGARESPSIRLLQRKELAQ